MATKKTAKTSVTTRKQLVALLNEDLQREFQAVMAYVNYSQVLKGAAYMNIAGELEVHAGEELKHALKLSYWIDLLGGMPAVTAKPVKTSEKATDMLRFDLENEKETIRNYRRRVKQADALDEFALSEDLRDILRDEQDHLNALATALGEDTPDPGTADESHEGRSGSGPGNMSMPYRLSSSGVISILGEAPFGGRARSVAGIAHSTRHASRLAGV